MKKCIAISFLLLSLLLVSCGNDMSDRGFSLKKEFFMIITGQIQRELIPEMQLNQKKQQLQSQLLCIMKCAKVKA